MLCDQFERRAYYEKQGDDGQALMIPYVKKRGMGDWWYAEATVDDPGMMGHVAIALLQEPGSAIQSLLLLHPPDLNAAEFRRVGIAELDTDSVGNYKRELGEVMSKWTEQTIRLV